MIYILVFILIIAAIYCVYLLVQSSRRLASLKGELPDQIEDLDKTRHELIEQNIKLKKEIERYKEILREKEKQ